MTLRESLEAAIAACTAAMRTASEYSDVETAEDASRARSRLLDAWRRAEKKEREWAHG